MKLYNRNSIFYIVINIPKKLKPRIGASQIWKSLRTKDKAIAKLRAEMMKMTINRKILSETINLEAEEDLDIFVRKLHYLPQYFDMITETKKSHG